VQVEPPEAIDNVDAITATPGVDAVHYGSADVQLRRDRAMYERDVDAVEDQDLETIVKAAKANGTFVVTGAVAPDTLSFWASLGVEMILATEEYLFIMQGSASVSEWARATLAGK